MKTSTIRRFIAAAAVAAMLTGCAAPAKQSETSDVSTQSQAAASSAPAQEMTFTDALGYTVQLSGWDRVASLYGSFAETWVLAGGSLVGATVDAVEERGMELGDGVALLGSVKEPNLEEIIAAAPDFLILSADIAAQVDMHDALTSAGIPHAYYRVDGVSDYLAMLEQFCQMTGREDLYEGKRPCRAGGSRPRSGGRAGRAASDRAAAARFLERRQGEGRRQSSRRYPAGSRCGKPRRAA